jgi:rare lipoprotein A (peptidoglycan hydrolase)
MKRSYKNSYGIIALVIIVTFLSSCAPYQAHKGTAYFKQRGKASWYGPGFAGRKTANGERFNPNQLTAAHKKLPFNTTLRVTNLDNGKSVIVRINDRGPFVGSRIIDLSKAAAKKIGLIATGTGMVEIETISPGKPDLKIAKKTQESLPVATPEATGVMLAARGPVRKNGVAHLIEVDTANEAPIQSDAPEPIPEKAIVEEPQDAPAAAKTAPLSASRGSSIEDQFVVTHATTAPSPKKTVAPQVPAQQAPPTEPESGTADENYSVNQDDF